ncbi:MAG: ABC transporter permease [Coriobacteriia bacterium]|nr:ABC transporter permease [Coriobacteriia bacterium]
MSNFRENLRRDGFVLQSLVSKDFKLKYRRSVLGVLWSVLNPLLMMIVLSAVFSFVFQRDIDNFPLYLILGQTVFNFMITSTTSSMTSIIDASSLIKKIRINKTLFPLEKVAFEVLNFAISLIAVVMVMVYFKVMPTVSILFLPLLLIYLVFFCAGLCLLLSSLAVFFRDVIHLWTVVTLAWMYVTPIFYPYDILPEFMQSIMQFNPMYHFVTYFREIALWHVIPSLERNLVCLGCAVIMFALGMFVFRKLQKRFILYV